MYVMLKQGWPGGFRRTVTDEEGHKETLQFSPGEPLEVDDFYGDQLAGDVGAALVILEPPVTVDVSGDEVERCQHTYSNGRQCKGDAEENGYCEKHQPEGE